MRETSGSADSSDVGQSSESDSSSSEDGSSSEELEGAEQVAESKQICPQNTTDASKPMLSALEAFDEVPVSNPQQLNIPCFRSKDRPSFWIPKLYVQRQS